MVIKTEPAFTWVYSCNKSLRGQCPPVLPAREVGYSPCSTCGSPLLHSKGLSSKEDIQMDNKHILQGWGNSQLGQFITARILLQRKMRI